MQQNRFQWTTVDVNVQRLRERADIAVGDTITFDFDDGTQERGQLTPEGIQIGNNFFEKVSDFNITSLYAPFEK